METIKCLSTNIEHTIDRPLKKGQSKVRCPECSSERKKKNDPSLSLNNERGIGFCHHCQTSFIIITEQKMNYHRPKFENNTKLSDSTVKWFSDRGINQDTLKLMKIGEGKIFMPQTGCEVNTIQFKYFRDGDQINIKYRDKHKNFRMVKDAEMILYNLDAVKAAKQLIMCEGEMDALTLIQCGYSNAVSVPNGASISNNLDYLDSTVEAMEHIDEFILCTDNDTAGIALRDQLAARLGIEKCSKVSYPTGGERECKDINEVLMKFGKHKVIECIEQRKQMPVEGIFTAADVKEELYDLYKHGLQPGLKIDDPLDMHLTFEPGRLYMVTGIPGHGKSEFVDYVVEKLNAKHGLKIGYFSPENHPIKLHVVKIAEKISGKKFSSSHTKREDFEKVISHIDKNFFFINPPEKYDLDSILDKARFLVKQKGIKVLVIDPWNKIEHQIPSGQSETNYVSHMLDKITIFAKRNNVVLFLIAHPRKINRIENQYDVPTLYDISGSANFYNKTDFGFTVYRDFKHGIVSVHVQKIKFRHLGREGMVQYTYDKVNGRFIPINK